MKCNKCGHKYFLESPGMGYSDPPGVFFWEALITIIITVCLFSFGEDYWYWSGFVGIIILILLVLSIITGMSDQKINNISDCPQCGFKPKIKPWSL